MNLNHGGGDVVDDSKSADCSGGEQSKCGNRSKSSSSSSSSNENENENWGIEKRLVVSDDPQHPANLICDLCRKFYGLGWVTGTGGGISIRKDDDIFIAPSGVQKELMKPEDMFVMDVKSRLYLRKPENHKPSACTNLFLAAFNRGAGACIHTHSQWAVLITLLVERQSQTKAMATATPTATPTTTSSTAAESNENAVFEIELLEQIKGIGRGRGKEGNLGYRDRLRVPIIENTAKEEDLTQSLEAAMDRYPETYAVLVQRHGIYVWGETVSKAKTQCESLDYIFQLAIEMTKLGIPWVKD